MSYRHLTQDERYQIAALNSLGLSLSMIGRLVDRHKSTISRELRRNRSDRRYRAQAAQTLALRRRQDASRRRRIPVAVWCAVEDRLRDDWSPEQITGRFRADGHAVPSHERIYQHIGHDRQAGGSLWRHLRCQKRRRRSYGSCRRGRFSGARSIHQRPAAVERRGRVGHWEADLMVSARSTAALLTVVDRKSRFLRLQRVANRKAETVTGALYGALRPFPGRVMSVTMDRGSEFADYDALEIALSAKAYFADPYSAWQRGSNENCNGLVRQYVPKGVDIALLADDEVRFIQDTLNNRPRKTLGFQTPREVMERSLKRVALRG